MARRQKSTLTRIRVLGTPFERIATDTRGFDTLLGGGLLRGGPYLFVGSLAAGKTILANQIAYDPLRRGQRVTQ